MTDTRLRASTYFSQKGPSLKRYGLGHSGKANTVAKTLDLSAPIDRLLFPFLQIIKRFIDRRNLKLGNFELKEFYEKLQELNLYKDFIDEVRRDFNSEVGEQNMTEKIKESMSIDFKPKFSFVFNLPSYVRQKWELKELNEKLVSKMNELRRARESLTSMPRPASSEKTKKFSESSKQTTKKKKNAKSNSSSKVAYKAIAKDRISHNNLTAQLLEKDSSPRTIKAKPNLEPKPSFNIEVNLNEGLEEEEKQRMMTTVEQEEIDATNYKQILREIFCDLNDIRENILNDLTMNDSSFQDNDFEQFLKTLEYLIWIFTNLKCKYGMDELGNLNMEFYAENETSYISLAEKLNYPLHLKILDNSFEYDPDNPNKNKQNKKIAQDEIIAKRTLQIENYSIDDIALFTPHNKCSMQKIYKFRRYDQNDAPHSCSHCENVTSVNKCISLKCSSVFRNIDKERLVYFMLGSVLKFDTISKHKEIFKYSLICHNYEKYTDVFRYREISKNYTTLKFSNSQEVIKMNNNFRNFYGEEVGYYYTWLSHFISWMCFPTLVGLLINLIINLIWIYDYVNLQDYHYNAYCDILYTCIIIIWGNLYISSWNDHQKLQNYIWGMEEYNLEETQKFESKGKSLLFMDFFIKQEEGIKPLIKNVVTITVILLMLIISISSTLFLFYIEYYYSSNQTISAILYYLIPITMYLIRETLTSSFYKIALSLTKWTQKNNKSEFRNSFVTKVIIFEFVNYYFNLYFIAFIKENLGICAFNDCFSELGNQLFIIQLTSIAHDFLMLALFLLIRRNKKKILKEIEEFKKEGADDTELIKSNKVEFYTRSMYKEESVDKEYLEVVMNYGYVIQFGAASPICFLFALVHAYISRLMDAFRMTQLQYVHIIHGSQGIGIFSKIISVITFIGLLTNICVNLFTSKNMQSVSDDNRWFLVLLTENVIVFILFFISYHNLPFWFSYKDKVKNYYIAKFVNTKSNIKVKSYANYK